MELSYSCVKIFAERIDFELMIFLGSTGFNPEVGCKAARDFLANQVHEINDLFYMVGFSKTEPAKKCVEIAPKLEDYPEIAKVVSKPTNLREAFQSIIISDFFELEIDGQAKLQELIELVKADDSVMAGALAISSAVSLWRKNNELNIDRLLEVVDLDDLYAQADQVRVAHFAIFENLV